jgi:hypothetical protein
LGRQWTSVRAGASLPLPQLPLNLKALPALEGLLVPAIPPVPAVPPILRGLVVPPLPRRPLLQAIAEVPAPREIWKVTNAA